MEFSFLNDSEALKALGEQFEKYRIYKQLSDAEILKKGGATKDALWRFRNGEPITTKNFIKILRGLGEIDQLYKLFDFEDEFRPSQQKPKNLPKRIHAKVKPTEEFEWGEDK